MHAGAIYSFFRFWHKGGVKTVTLCNGFYRHLKGYDIVRSSQTLIIMKINFMLCRGHLMIGSFDLKSHIFQIHHDITPYILCKIQRTHIKIPGFFMSHCSRKSFIIQMEQEKFTFRAGIKLISHISRTV